MERPDDIDKLYLTNRSALEAKYGAASAGVLAALDDLVQADAARGVTSFIALLDDPDDHMTPVRSPDDHVETKVAIDEWFVLCAPDYLVIVGGVDVVCMYPLANPVPDTDPDVPSDLPYACSAPASPSIGRFIAPDRVVGRIPDVTGETDPSGFVSILRSTADRTPTSEPRAETVFAVAAQKWSAAGENLLDIGVLWPMTLHLSPPSGPDWPDEHLELPWHVLSCHGASGAPSFWGEDMAGGFPTAIDAPDLAGRIAPGTVCVTGSCFGAELYPPGIAAGVPGMPFAYLSQGAAGYTGSTTIAYGTDDHAFGCDELCGYLLSSYRQGGSVGRSLLEARLRFVDANPDLAPELQKTLAQFVVYGDPERHPFTAPPDDPGEGRALRREGRERLRSDARRVESVCRPATPRSTPDSRALAGRSTELNRDDPLVSAMLERGFEPASVATFSVGLSAMARGRAFALVDDVHAADADPEGARRVRSMAVAVRVVDSDAPAPVWEGLRLSESSDGTITEQRFWSR
jgi:hypothetical protein